MKPLIIPLAIALGCAACQSLQSESNFSANVSYTPEVKHFENLMSWHDLQLVQFKDVYIDSLDAWFWQPEFHECLHDLEGETVHISGFLQNQSTVVDPFYLACKHKKLHFGCCSATGPEEMIDLGKEFDPKTYKPEDSMMFKGTLRLNESNVYELTYILENAEVVN